MVHMRFLLELNIFCCCPQFMKKMQAVLFKDAIGSLSQKQLQGWIDKYVTEEAARELQSMRDSQSVPNTQSTSTQQQHRDSSPSSSNEKQHRILPPKAPNTTTTSKFTSNRNSRRDQLKSSSSQDRERSHSRSKKIQRAFHKSIHNNELHKQKMDKWINGCGYTRKDMRNMTIVIH